MAIDDLVLEETGYQLWYKLIPEKSGFSTRWIGKEERRSRGQLWMEQYSISLKYWPIYCTITADPNHIWGSTILADFLLFSINTVNYLI